MKIKPILMLTSVLMLLQACSSSNNSPSAVDAPPATNPDGTLVTGVITAIFEPASGDPTKVPLPTNLFFKDTTDLTLNIPVEDPNNYSDPLVSLNGLDGFSTTSPWATNFSVPMTPASVNPATVRLFQVSLTGPGGGVTGIQQEMTFGVDFVAVANGASINIVHLRPLQEMTTYMAVLTNGIKDSDGNAATPDQQYFISKRTSPLVDANGNSTDPLLDNATAQGLEGLRQLTNSQEYAASQVGINPDDIVLSWTATTQSITPVMSAVKAISGPGQSVMGPSGANTSLIGGAGIADIYVGTMTTPYYLEAPTAANPTAALTGRWQAAPGPYMPPFDAFGLDPSSTHVTVAKPIPVANSIENIPVLMTVPNAASGMTKPAEGWPVVIFQHGITQDRTNLLAIADTMASLGYVVVGIDLPLHGITDPTNPLYIENSPFAPISNERTFDMDLDQDGVIDSSAAHYINLTNLLVSRDNIRQGVADVLTLTHTIPLMDIDMDGSPDLNAANVSFSGLSLGAITGVNYLALNPDVQSGFLSAPGGGITNFLIASPSFGPSILGGLAAIGVNPGTTEFNLFVLATQTSLDSADPINFGAMATANHNILVHEILGDNVIPNAVANAPLSGTEPLMAVMGLMNYSESAFNADGLDASVRFSQGSHSSLLNPADGPAVTAEMQGQMAAWILSRGTTLNVNNTDVIQ
ncbi:Ig-like domain-containing protein [Marinicella rhabdoformis]|uniref:alpha/beta hydrolase n=1 Tax=Marinicella rhabdoformis TaxID=2580566 RepID=UPI0012AED6B6|nr:Ig-like domain-containing protein [Marinicella rhabdoformis]